MIFVPKVKLKQVDFTTKAQLEFKSAKKSIKIWCHKKLIKYNIMQKASTLILPQPCAKYFIGPKMCANGLI